MRLKASVTIFLSLVITVVIVVVCTVIESARISVSQMEGKAATYMAVESVFAVISGLWNITCMGTGAVRQSGYKIYAG